MISGLFYRTGRAVRRRLWRAFVDRSRPSWDAQVAQHRGRRVIILFTPRSGSKVLVSYLRSLCAVECQYELLNPNYLRRCSRLAALAGATAARFETPEAAHLFVAGQLACDEEEIVGAKFTPGQLERSGTSIEEFVSAFRHESFVVLYRASLAEQYVSLRTARETAEWGHFRRDDGKQRARTRIEFDAEEFTSFAADIRTAYSRTLKTLEDTGARYLPLAYEDMCCAEPDALRSQLAEFLGTTPGTAEVTFDTRKQALGAIGDRVTNPDALADVDIAQQLRLGPAEPAVSHNQGTSIA